MNFKLVFKLAGKTLLVAAACMVLPLLVTLLYREDPMPFLSAMGITALAGLLLSLLRADTRFNSREGFFSAGLIWLLVGFFGALPFQFSGYFPSFVDCLFESISGFTTTGASILTAVEPLPKGILFWRSFIHWLGGMGILVLTIALLPSLGARTLHVMKAESPGPIISKLVPKSSQSSKILYGIYLVLTVLVILALRAAGMDWFDSVTHAFATAGTGGFSTRNLSVGAYQSPAVEIVLGIAMLLFSVNFALYFLILCGKWRQALKSDELRFFASVVGGSVLLIACNIQSMYGSFLTSLRHAFFQVSSIISTTFLISDKVSFFISIFLLSILTKEFLNSCSVMASNLNRLYFISNWVTSNIRILRSISSFNSSRRSRIMTLIASVSSSSFSASFINFLIIPLCSIMMLALSSSVGKRISIVHFIPTLSLSLLLNSVI